MSINFANIQAGREGNFAKQAGTYVDMPYDYLSIMQYGWSSFAIDYAIGTITPINCEPNCPSKYDLGARTGFTLLDQKQASDMYHCTRDQNAIRTATTECIDWMEVKSATLDCAAYKAAGKCSTDARPCCNCGKWNSGLKQRKWITAKPVSECKDIRQKEICDSLKADNMCWSGFVRQQCESTCEVCTVATGQDYNDDMTGRGVLPFPGGKNFVGTVVDGKPNGMGVLTWGNSARHIGEFVNGNPKAGTQMIRTDKDGRTFKGAFSNWLYATGQEYPAAASSLIWQSGAWTAAYKLADGACKFQWANASYDGACKAGLARGQGKLTWAAGVYDGAWVNGKPNGNGVVSFTGAGTFTASWTNGAGTGKYCKSATECADWTFSLF